MAAAFASHHKQGGKVIALKLKEGLKMLDSMSPLMLGWKEEMGLGPFDYYGDPVYAKTVTSKAKRKGYDGIVSDSLAEGIVVFDPKNVKRVKDES